MLFLVTYGRRFHEFWLAAKCNLVCLSWSGCSDGGVFQGGTHVLGSTAAVQQQQHRKDRPWTPAAVSNSQRHPHAHSSRAWARSRKPLPCGILRRKLGSEGEGASWPIFCFDFCIRASRRSRLSGARCSRWGQIKGGRTTRKRRRRRRWRITGDTQLGGGVVKGGGRVKGDTVSLVSLLLSNILMVFDIRWNFHEY